tara:strand:+ start:1580 stop:1780 length:201 start_codon:yes stop_codon:yes gene_type:complete
MIHITFENQETVEFQDHMIDEILVYTEMNGMKILCVRCDDFSDPHGIAEYCNLLNFELFINTLGGK